MLRKLKQYFQKLNLTKRKLISFGISVLIAAPMFFLSEYYGEQFNQVMWVLLGIILTILVAMVAAIAGYAVVKSLIGIAAGLSLLIFIAQSYCDTSIRDVSGDGALASLFVMVSIYLIVAFGKILLEILSSYYKRVENEVWSWEKVVTVALFLFFVGFFVWEIYLVMKPIVLDLCVF
tara:strand:- start:1071 stop:1601 length:531 start_codon:yes stop_codon:yes gene_type:complete